MEIKLQLLHQVVEVCRVEGNYVLGDPVVVAGLATMDCLQHPHCRCSLTVQSVAHMVGMGTRPVLKVVLTGLRLAGQVLQVLQLIDAGSR